MDQTEKQKHQYNLSQVMKSQFQRKLTQLLLSVSVFSLFFSCSYELSLLHSFDFNFHNSLPFQLFRYTLDKKCMFLVCNGLLVFLVKNSGLINSNDDDDDDDDDGESFKSYEDDVTQSDQSSDLELKAPLLDNEAAALDSTVDPMKHSTMMVEEEKLLFGPDIEEIEICDREEEEEEELVEENKVLSTEELNKRFDEFIAKMREELRFEARQVQQLFMV